MSTSAFARVATLGGAPDQLTVRSARRFAALLAVCFLGHVFLEPHARVDGVGPDFYLIAVVFGALRWGPLAGAVLGFGLGINVDAMRLDDFGMHGLAFTMTGFGLGKMKESLYLDLPALDVILLFAAGTLTGLLTTALAAHGSFALFEERFFYEVPLGALVTALVGGALFRLLKKT